MTHVQFGKTRIDYELKRSDRRTTIGISVHPTGTVEVTAPPNAGWNTVHDAVRDKAAWILKQRRDVRQLAAPAPPRRYKDGESYLYLGRNYRLRLLQGAKDSRMRAGRLHVTVPDPSDKDAVATAVKNWYRNRARAVFAERLRRFTQELGVQVPELRLRGQSKRWGSCTDKATIWLNWQLIAAPAALVDYVLAHECVHLVHRHHNAAFWNQLRALMADFPRRERRLETEGPRYVQF